MDTPTKALTLQYWQDADELRAKFPDAVPEQDLDDFFLPWLASQGRRPLDDARPWITFAAARSIEQHLTPTARVFEFGAGGSTLFFSERVAELVTTEHDPQWLAETAARMQPAGSHRWRAHLLPPAPRPAPRNFDPADPQAYASTDERYEGLSFEAYASAIERYADNSFDLVLIDGRARPACFKHAWAKTRFGGLIVLDNAERPAYAWVAAAAQALGCELTWCWGPGPFHRYFWCTLVMRKARERFALDDLDLKLERYLDFDGGTFVEAGANNGVAYSNTLYYEAKRGWRGLLVEPIFARAQECRRLRPHARVEHAALVAADSTQRIATLRYADMMTVVRGAMHSAEEEDAHIRAGCEVQRLETYEFSAPTATLSGLLDKHGIDRVDLLSLDVEGYEATVLRGLDLARHRPRYILVEARYRADIEARLAADYEVVDTLSHHDVLYRLKRDPGAPARTVTAPGATACIACATPMTELFAGMFDARYGYPGHFSLLRCPACGQLQTAPLFEDTDLPAVDAHYGPSPAERDEATQIGANGANSASRWPNAEDSAIRAAWKQALRPGIKALIVGRGIDGALHDALRSGADVAGIEAGTRVAGHADAAGAGRIHVGTLADKPFADEVFDVIVLDRALEFMPRPAGLLAQLAARLRPGGRVFLSLPNADSLLAQRFGRDWIQWCLPYRQHHFNRGSLQKFLARQGWEVVSLRTITPDPRNILQLRAARESVRMGQASPLWTGRPAPQPESAGDADERGLVTRALRSLYDRAHDARGHGEFMLVEMRKREV